MVRPLSVSFLVAPFISLPSWSCIVAEKYPGMAREYNKRLTERASASGLAIGCRQRHSLVGPTDSRRPAATVWTLGTQTLFLLLSLLYWLCGSILVRFPLRVSRWAAWPDARQRAAAAARVPAPMARRYPDSPHSPATIWCSKKNPRAGRKCPEERPC